ncbi:DNA polymerase delta subunit 2, partial [Armadillidium vulgare]
MILKKPNENNVYDSLLSSPSENDTSQQLERPVTESYVNHSEKYLLGNSKNSSRQYYEMYTARLAIMRSTVEEKIKLRWGDVKINRLHELQEEEPCFIIGTLVKRQDLKPSILKELSEENQLVPQPVLEKFTSDDDEIILEDELQRIQLKGKINVHELVTGFDMVCN